jgi:two-component system OmpR family sensor kinase
VNLFRSVGARLGLGLAIVLTGALVLVDLIVVPTLERNLINAKLGQLREAAPTIASQVRNSSPFTLDEVVHSAADSANARVIYFHVLNPSPLKLFVFADSSSVTSADVEDDRLAPRAFLDQQPLSGTLTSEGERFAEVAYPVLGGQVVLLRASLADSLQSVQLVRRRLVIAGLIALAAALLVGYIAASLFARRIRRLERAADRIAGGDFNEPVSDRGQDELGDLAGTMDRMRLRLAQLEHARREFIANASHELRTPLFSLGGFLELMDEEDLDPETQAEFMATMREQVDRLTKLATDLLDLSRLDAGRLRVEEEAVDLAEVAASLVDEFRAVARTSGHEVVIDAAGEATALGDAERALQIGRILVGNALVHTPPGTPVRLRTAHRDGSVLLSVEDEGPGIPREHADHVFERFYRVDGGVASGSGLGLAIARELAELMGGSVELHLLPGVTMFALVLPSATPEPFPREKGRETEPSLQ